LRNDRDYERRRGPSVFGWVAIGLLVLLVLGVFLAPILWGGFGMMAPSTTNPRMYFGWFFFPLGFLFVLFIIFIIFFAFRLMWYPWWGRRYYYGGWSRRDEASEILRQRYARGEISKDQYDQMMRDLEQHR
jgi:putative membrane protein